MKIAVVSSFPPRKCGVASFTQDLINSLKKLDPSFLFSLYPIEDNQYIYPREVKIRIKEEEKDSYLQAAEMINQGEEELVLLQHQFLLFGEEGKLTLPFLQSLKKPMITIIHTVPYHPTEREREALIQVGRSSAKITVMIGYARKLLVEEYGVDKEKIKVIYHPFPRLEILPSQVAKEKLGLPSHSFILSTFGLIRREKGLENVIKALGLLKDEPQVIYLILGCIHPFHQKREGSTYLEELKELSKKLGVREKVKFVTHFLSLPELSLYLSATDIYITPYLSNQQVSSGTLTFALGAGKVVISTPYPFAQEVLGRKRGILVEFGDYQSIAREVRSLLHDVERKKEIEERVARFTRNLNWENMAKRYYKLIKEVVPC